MSCRTQYLFDHKHYYIEESSRFSERSKTYRVDTRRICTLSAKVLTAHSDFSVIYNPIRLA